MTGAGGGSWQVTSWGWFTDEDNVKWRRWAVRHEGRRLGFIETEPDADPGDVLVMAVGAWELYADDAQTPLSSP